MQNSQLGPNDVLYREVPLYSVHSTYTFSRASGLPACSSRVVVCEEDTNHTECVLCMYQVFD